MAKKVVKKEKITKKKVTPKKVKKIIVGEATKKRNKAVEKAAAANDPSLVKDVRPNPHFKRTWKSEVDPEELLKEIRAEVGTKECEQACKECNQHFEESFVDELKRKAPKATSGPGASIVRKLNEEVKMRQGDVTEYTPASAWSTRGFMKDGDLQLAKSLTGGDERDAFVKAACAVVEYYKNTTKEKNELVRLLNEEVGVLRKKNILLEAKVNRAESTIEKQLDLSKFKDKM